MVEALKFSCGDNSSLCLNSLATCALDSTENQVCICPNTHQHDLTYTQSPSCAMPHWYLPTFFAVTTCGVLWAIILLLRELRHLNNALRRIGILLIILLLCQWLVVFCVFIQNGNFAASLVFSGIFGIFLSRLAFEVTMVLTSPIYAALRRPITRWRQILLSVSSLFGCTTLGLFFASIAYIPRGNEDSSVFNALMISALALVSAAFAVLITVVLIQSIWLERILRSALRIDTEHATMVSDKIRALIKQLQSLRRVLAALTLNPLVHMVTIIITFQFHSVPYQFIWWSIHWSTLWPVSPFVVRFFRSKEYVMKIDPRGDEPIVPISAPISSAPD